MDDYVFDPCGYSLNGLLGPYYYTIHVTPEEICSYASFETTIPVNQFKQGMGHDTFAQVIQMVIDAFKPSQFSTSLFVRHELSRHYDGLLKDAIPGFKAKSAVVQSLGHWELYFSQYEKGLARRLSQ